MPKTHRLDAGAETVHWGYFDAKLPPLLTIDSGDTVTISTVSGARELMPPPPLVVPAALAAVQAHVQPKLPGHICTGPVAVKGAKAGQVLEVRIKGDRAALRLGLQHVPARSPARCRTTSPTRHLIHIPLDRQTHDRAHCRGAWSCRCGRSSA